MPRQRRRETPKPQLTLFVEAQHQAALKQIALNYGYTIPSGTQFGEGNISALVRAIAIGELTVSKN